MQVQLRTDNHVEGSAKMAHYVQAEVEEAMQRFGSRITRVEVHLGDESSGEKVRDNGKKCILEARLGGLHPISVTHHAATLEQALDGAINKLRNTLDRTLGRLEDSKNRPIEDE